MIHETIYLKKHFKNINSDAYFKTYCPDNFEEFSTTRKRKAVLILPGGGYEFISEREGEPIALQFLKDDIAAFVLNYTVGDFNYPTPIDEVFATLLYIRKNADKYHIDINNIALLGFSAGGHLAASCGMLWNDSYFAKLFNTSNNELKLNAILLGYPVITMDPLNSHLKTLEKRTHNDPTLLDKFSIEKHISKDYPKTFIWLTASDDLVPAYNSLILAQKLVDNNIMVELHMYPEGPHGLALADTNTCLSSGVNTNYPEVHTWIEHCLTFINEKM